jgi:hypothetical protein
MLYSISSTLLITFNKGEHPCLHAVPCAAQHYVHLASIEVLWVVDAHGIIVDSVGGEGGSYEGYCFKWPPIRSGGGFSIVTEAIDVVLIAGEVVFKLYVEREEWGAERLQGNTPPMVAMVKVRFVIVRIPR